MPLFSLWEDRKLITHHGEAHSLCTNDITDIDTIIKCPLLSQLDDEQVQSMYEYAYTLKTLKTSRDRKLDITEIISDFHRLFRALKQRSLKYVDNDYSDKERRLLKQANDLLRLARSTGSSPSERDVAYSRLEKTFRDLHVILPEGTKEQLIRE